MRRERTADRACDALLANMEQVTRKEVAKTLMGEEEHIASYVRDLSRKEAGHRADNERINC